MALPANTRCKFQDMSMDEIRTFGAIEIGDALNQISRATLLLAEHAEATRSQLSDALNRGAKQEEREARFRLQSIGDQTRALKLAASIFQTQLRTI